MELRNDFSAVEFFKCFADRSRLKILRLLQVNGDSYPELIAKQLSLTAATVCFHLKKLEVAGLVESRRDQFYIMYSLKPDVLTQSLSDILAMEHGDSDAERQRQEYEKDVIRNFIKSGKLTAIPVQKKKRDIILRHIAQSFDLGRTYTEKEVNLIISAYHDDFCTIRRELIGIGLMTRNHEIYQRME